MSDLIPKEVKDVLDQNDIANQLAPQPRKPVKDYLQERAATHYVMENERLHAEIEALRAENTRLREALKNARAAAIKEGAEIAFAYNGMPRSEIAQAFARAAMGESDE